MSCTYNGTKYSEGSIIVVNGAQYKCRGGSWVSYGFTSQTNEHFHILAPYLSLITTYIRDNTNEQEKFKLSPTKYIQDKLNSIGFDNLDNLHVHYQSRDELYPPDDEFALANRQALIMLSENEVEIKNLDVASLRGNCNNCGFCVIIVL